MPITLSGSRREINEKQPSAHQMANAKDLVMPFGLINAPVVFQALVNDVMVMMCDDDRSIFVCLLKWKFHSSSIFLGYNQERGQVRTNPEMMTSAPVLVHADPDHQFLVEVDASNTAVGAVLS